MAAQHGEVVDALGQFTHDVVVDLVDLFPVGADLDGGILHVGLAVVVLFALGADGVAEVVAGEEPMVHRLGADVFGAVLHANVVDGSAVGSSDLARALAGEEHEGFLVLELDRAVVAVDVRLVVQAHHRGLVALGP